MMHPHTWVTGRFLSWREVLVPRLRRPREGGGRRRKSKLSGGAGAELGALRRTVHALFGNLFGERPFEATKHPTVFDGKAQEQNSLRAEQKSETVNRKDDRTQALIQLTIHYSTK